MADLTNSSTLPIDSESAPERAPSAEPKPTSAEDPVSMSGAVAPSSEPATTGDETSKPPAESDPVKPDTDSTDEPAPLKTEEPSTTEEAQPDEDTEMKKRDSSTVAAPDIADDDAAHQASAANGATPAKKSSRKSGGVPEHKGSTKKLNRKKSKMITHLDAQPGEYYFARLKSYPPWPSIVCDEAMLPQSLLSTRPVTTKQPDGTYREAYADGGKRVYERTFPIMFLHTNEFAWIPNTDLTPLTKDDVTNFPEKGKSKALLEAFRVAQEQHDLQYFKDMLRTHMEAVREDQLLAEQRAAEKAEKAAKKKRKSNVADDDVEMEDAEVEAKGSKKRKKDADSEGDNDKPSKKPATKLKLSTPKTPASEKKKEPKESKTKAKGGKKGKETVSDEGDAEAEATKEPQLSEAEIQAKKEKEVLYLRHKLQKGLLTRDQVPKEDEMRPMSEFLQKLERYPDLEVSTIRSTKINKVLKAIIKLPNIPRDEEFKVRERSATLLGKWNILLGANEAGPSEDAAEKAEPTTNGIHKDEGEDSSEKADAPADVEMADKTEEKPTEEKTETPGASKSDKPDDAENEAPTTGATPEDTQFEQKENAEGESSEAPASATEPAAETAAETAEAGA